MSDPRVGGPPPDSNEESDDADDRAPSGALPFATFPRGLAPLGFRDYGLFWFGSGITRFGRAVEEIGTVWLLYELTGSPLLLGLLGIARALPSAVLGPIAGVTADRVDQRRLVAISQALGFVASMVMGMLVVTGLVEFWHLYIQVAIQAVVQSFDAGSRQALFPRLVPRSQISSAITLNSTAGRSAQLAGPAIGGILIASVGEAAPFFLNAATFVVMAGAAILLRGSFRGEPSAASFRSDLVEGMRYIVDAPVLSGLLKLELVFGIFQVNAVLVTVLAREHLGVGAEGLGGLLAAPSLGALAAIACLLALGNVDRKGRFVVVAALVYALALVGLAASDHYPISFAVLAVLGFLDALMTVTRHSVMQLAAPPRMRGRVMGNMGTVTRGVSPLAEVQSGAIAGVAGAPVAIMVAAVALGGAAVATARANPDLWRFRTSELPVEPAATLAR